MARQAALGLLLIASHAAIPQQAAARYTVEIVVFRNASQTGALPAGAPAATPDDGVETAPVTTRKLTSAANKLRGTAGYRVLAHTAWAQSPTSCDGRVCRESFRGVTSEQLGIARAGVSGKVGLQRGQQALHLGIDLTIDDGGRRYRIQELRQIKVDQPQYFDHPAVGVLAIVTAGG